MRTLATRCSHCSTVFRVVPDQLRVADGLVRCGRCGEVFNAAENLIDVDSAAAVQPGGPAAAVGAPDGHQPGGSDFELNIEPEPARRDAAPQPDAEPWAQSGPEPEDPLPLSPAAATDADPQHPPRIEPALAAEPVAEERAALATPEAELRAEPEQAPSFMRSPDGPSRWEQPRRRRALALACALGLLLLAGQAAHTWRDRLAASAPGLRGPLTAACSVLGCQIEAVRAIDSLAVDSSGLVRVERSDVYKLQVALRNRASQPVAVPALDVTLSDATGRLIARRVLRAAELGVTETTVAAGRELSLQATLQARLAGTEAIAGYTIELFYP